MNNEVRNALQPAVDIVRTGLKCFTVIMVVGIIAKTIRK